MNILFLGGLFPPNTKTEIINNSKHSIQNAANTMQWHFVHGLDSNSQKPVILITAPLVGSFPMLYKKLFLKKTFFSHNQTSRDICVGYCNFTVIKNYFIRKALSKELEGWAKENPDEVKIVVVYGMLPPWVIAAIQIKRRYPNIKLCLIVPDLPKFMSDSKNILYKIRGYFQPNLYSYLPTFDSFVFLTDKMADHFGVQHKPWVRIEGMVDPAEIVFSTNIESTKKKVVMYSGTLAERYGIIDLLTAFQGIEEMNYELWICGSGDTQELIKSKTLSDKRIKYFGLLSRDKVLEMQTQATVLVNPRNSEGEFTKYSFPSKIMEYLLSGTPCIMKTLPGIPNEYYKYIFLVDDNDSESLKNKIKEVCSLDYKDLKDFGESARKFVLEMKNYKVQVKKMTDMFKTLE
jgi:glycosyltransferase involved in cell wall biosynthesis